MTTDPRTEAAAKALAGRPIAPKGAVEVYHGEARLLARTALAAADAAAVADEALHARLTAWVGRTYTADKPTTGQVRMVLAALTALSKEQQT